MRTRTFGVLTAAVALSTGCGGDGGDGDGSSAIEFSDAVRTNLIQLPPLESPAVGHFDDDALPDVAFGDQGAASIGVGLGRGDGTFEPLAPVVAGVPGVRAGIVRTAFLNLDAFADLVVVDEEASLVQTLLGRGDGRFDPAMQLPLEFVNDVNDVAVGRLDADVLDDVVVATAGGVVTVFLSVGDGLLIFGTDYSFASADRIELVRLEGVSNDPLDLLVIDDASDVVHVLEGDGLGAFSPLAPLPVPEGPAGAVVVDVGPSVHGIVVSASDPVGVRVFVPTGVDTFGPTAQGHVPLPGTIAGDPVVIPRDPMSRSDVFLLTADLPPDADEAASHATLLRLDPVETGIVTATTETRAGILTIQPTVADIDLDGRADLVMTGFELPLQPFLEVRFGI